ERAMGVATGGEALELVAAHPPGLAEPHGGRVRIERTAIDVAHDRGDGVRLAGEARVAQRQRLEAGARAVARIDVAHRGAVIERLAARRDAKGRRDVDRLSDRVRTVAAKLAERERGSERTIGAVRMHRMARR